MEDIDKRIDDYSELFDLYIEGQSVPKKFKDDPVAGYIEEICQDTGNQELCRKSEAWKEIFRKEIVSMLEGVLPVVSQIEKEYENELEMLSNFFSSSIEQKRLAWNGIAKHLHEAFDSSMFNIHGYIQEFWKKQKSTDEIFDAMEANWKEANNQRKDQKIKQVLSKSMQNLEQEILSCGDTDFKKEQRKARFFHKYPQLKEIAKKMGREKEKSVEMDDATMNKYIPILLKHSHDKQDIDGVALGNNLDSLLPTEIAMMDSPTFYAKFAKRQLQQFSSKAAQTKQEKSTVRYKKPRLQQGPMIICIDTSGSMSGRPVEIAKSLLQQLADIAKKEKRSCFLVSFSIRTKTLDLSRPSNYYKMDKFFKDSYSGGTCGEEMLKETLKILNTEKFSMADALIISDFCFPSPLDKTMRSLKEEQAKGTRFYGLNVHHRNSYSKNYEDILDKMWNL